MRQVGFFGIAAIAASQDIDALKGKTFSRVERLENGDRDDCILFENEEVTVRMEHSQDCCESVSIKEIVGDLSDLIGSPIIEAEEVTSDQDGTIPPPEDGHDESWTWTFYKLGTVKGHVNISWFGTSNGYYSEAVYITTRQNAPKDERG